MKDLNERKAQNDAEEAARRAEEAAKRQKALHRALFKILWNHSARVIQVRMGYGCGVWSGVGGGCGWEIGSEGGGGCNTCSGVRALGQGLCPAPAARDTQVFV